MGVGTVAIFSILLIAIPLGTFFAVLHGTIDSYIGLDTLSDSNRLIFAGIIGVVSVNLVVAAFLIAAWREPVPPSTTSSKKEQ